MKICTNCKKVAEDEHLFCPACGNKLVEMVPAESPKKEESKQEEPKREELKQEEPKREELKQEEPKQEEFSVRASALESTTSRKLFFAVGGLVALIVILLIILVVMVGNKKSGKDRYPDSDYEVTEDVDFNSDAEKNPELGKQSENITEEKTEDIFSTPISLKKDVYEGRNTTIQDGVIFWTSGNSLCSALVAEDGSLYEYVKEGDFGIQVSSVCLIGTDMYLGTAEGIYLLDLHTAESGGTSELSMISDFSYTDYFCIYNEKIYLRYGYSLYSVSVGSKAETKLAEEITDFEVTNQCIYYTAKEGGLYSLTLDGEKKEKIADTPVESYISVGEEYICYWNDTKSQLGIYDIKSKKAKICVASHWRGEYSGQYMMWPVGDTVYYVGEGYNVYKFDRISETETLCEEFRREISGKSFSVPGKEYGMYLDGTFYYANNDFTYWNSLKNPEVAGFFDSNGTTHDLSSNETQQTNNANNTKPEPEDGASIHSGTDSSTFVTEMYSLTIPSKWEKAVEMRVYPGEYNDYFVEFDHADSKAAGMGGYLFGIDMYMEGDTGYEDLPSYQVLGRLIYRQAEVYTIVVTFPTDVQFDDNTASEYYEISDQIDSVLKTFAADSMYTFEPYKK